MHDSLLVQASWTIINEVQVNQSRVNCEMPSWLLPMTACTEWLATKMEPDIWSWQKMVEGADQYLCQSLLLTERISVVLQSETSQLDAQTLSYLSGTWEKAKRIRTDGVGFLFHTKASEWELILELYKLACAEFSIRWHEFFKRWVGTAPAQTSWLRTALKNIWQSRGMCLEMFLTCSSPVRLESQELPWSSYSIMSEWWSAIRPVLGRITVNYRRAVYGFQQRLVPAVATSRNGMWATHQKIMLGELPPFAQRAPRWNF